MEQMMKKSTFVTGVFRKSAVVALMAAAYLVQGAEKKPDLWLDHKFAVLPGASSKGFDRKSAYALSNRGLEKLRLPEKRPVPTADFLLKDTPGRDGSIAYKKVPVELLEEAGVARTALIRFGFPLPEGGLFDLAHLRLSDGAKEIPASYSVTGKYPDGSLRWVMIRAAVPLTANEKKTFFVEFGSKLPPRGTGEGVRVREDGDFIFVDNGAISCRINKKRFTLVQDVRLGNSYCGSVNGFGTLMVFRDGKRFGTYKTPPVSVKRIESAPEHVTYRIDGVFGEVNDPYGSYTARLSFHKGVPGFDLEYTHINTNMRYEFTDIKSMTIGFSTGRGECSESVAAFHRGHGGSRRRRARRPVRRQNRLRRRQAVSRPSSRRDQVRHRKGNGRYDHHRRRVEALSQGVLRRSQDRHGRHRTSAGTAR